MNATNETLVLDRTKYIGGSDIAAILGVSPWRNVVDLWMDKITPRVENGQNAAAKRRGSRMEPYILDMIREEHGLNIVACNQRYIDAEFGYMAAEIDFEYLDEETGQVENGEIKTVHPFKAKEWGEVDTDQLPLHYVAQVQYGMGVKGARRCRAFALIGDDLKAYQVERDDELITAMRERAAEFWTEYVLPQVQPPLDYEHKDIIETLQRLYPGTDGTVIPADSMHEHWRGVMTKAVEMRDHYQAIIDGSKAHLLAEMGNASAILFSDGKAYTRKVINKKAYTVDYAATSYVDFRLAKFKESN